MQTNSPTPNSQDEQAIALLRRIEPHIDAIVCYASTMDEHEPNRLAVDLRAYLATHPSPVSVAGEREAFERYMNAMFGNEQHNDWYRTHPGYWTTWQAARTPPGPSIGEGELVELLAEAGFSYTRCDGPRFDCEKAAKAIIATGCIRLKDGA